MSPQLIILTVTAASVGFFHTLLGPDHYMPFIVMAKARQWSYVKTVWITFLCGLGHIGSSIVLGLLGVAFGIAVEKLELFESFRGNLAAWGLIAFGLIYFIYGVRRIVKNKPHTHFHFHGNGEMHNHKHTHYEEHAHIHESHALAKPVPFALFIVFILGPCEPLIPILMYPAAKHNFSDVILVAGIFGSVTILTMLTIVIILTFGINLLPLKQFERYGHALAGAVILICGCAIQFLGL
jgi:sulfite exporter TauE/SafE